MDHYDQMELRKFALQKAAEIGATNPDDVLTYAQRYYAWLCEDDAGKVAPSNDNPKGRSLE